MNIPLSNPDITEKEKKAVMEVLNTPQLSCGPKIIEFERQIADFIGVKYATAVSSGTAALHVIIRSLGIGNGEYVLTTPFSFISSSNCVLFEGAEPIFVDIDEHTYNINPESVESVYLSLEEEKREKIRGIIYVDIFGVPADGEGFERLGKKYGLKIIEDSAEALGSSVRGKKCGSFGDAGLFAFYPNKQITTGEGGMVVTNSQKIDRMAKSLKNQGRDEGAGWLQHARLGYNYRISDINAALGVAQMERIDEILNKRKWVKQLYDSYFEQMFKQGLMVPQKNLEECVVSPFVYVLRLSDGFTNETRDELFLFLRKNGIQCSDYFTPIHLQPPYQKLGWTHGDMPVTEMVSERTVALPFFNNLREEQIAYVVEKVSDFFKNEIR